MNVEIGTAPIKERFDHLLKVISGERFLKMLGLGNEVPFFICPYDPKNTVEMAKLQTQLSKKLESSGIQVLEINLYDLAVQLLKDRDIWEKTCDIEQETPKDAFLEHLVSVLHTESHLVPAIAQLIADHQHDVLFVSGIGEVFPYIRSHTVLNNLQKVAKDKPSVFFFPGDYTHSDHKGSSLDLFGKLHDDNYYRAFNIYHCEA